jgi:hypothetical protein
MRPAQVRVFTELLRAGAGAASAKVRRFGREDKGAREAHAVMDDPGRRRTGGGCDFGDE